MVAVAPTPSANTGGFSSLSKRITSMTQVQIRFITAQRRIENRKKIEQIKAVLDMRNQTVMV